MLNLNKVMNILLDLGVLIFYY